jgi:hypothetical protein
MESVVKLRRILLAGLAGSLSGCLSINPPDGALLCAPSGKACPDGYQCVEGACYRSTSSPDLASGAQLTADAESRSFGDVTVGQSASATVTITNSGSASSDAITTALSGTTSELSLVADGCAGVALAPAASCTVGVAFSPTSTGAKSATLTVAAPDGGTVTVALTGNAVAAGALTIAPTTEDFGAVTSGQTSTPTPFTIRNSGGTATGSLNVSITGSDNVHFSLAQDHCTGQPLVAGGSCQVQVVFAPTAVGARSATLTASAPMGGTATAQLTGTAVASGALAITPTAQDFGRVVAGQSSGETTFSVKNGGGAITALLSVSVGGTDGTQFTRTADACSGATLAPSAICAIKVRFTPTSPGMKSATLTVSGAGSAIADLSGAGITPGVIAISPATSDFGSVVVGATGSDTSFTVTNSGQGATGVLGTATVSGGNASDFAVAMDGCATTTLAAGASCTIKVRFLPTAAGARAATLSVSATPGGTASSSLSGTALAPAALTVTPATQGFGSVVIGSASADTTLTVQNSGGVASGPVAATLGGANAGDFAIGASTCTGALSAGATCTVAVHFAPTSAGAKAATLAVSASPGGSASAALTGTGLAPGALALAPTSHGYGSLLVGATTADFSFTVMNSGGVATGTLAASITGTDAGQFAIATNGCTGTLAAGASCTVSVHFAPTAAGSKQASLVVAASPGGNATAGLSGTALAPAGLAIAPALYSFGPTVVGQSSPGAPFTISNSGGVATSTPTVTLTGTNAAEFTITSNGCTAALQPGASCAVVVVLTPSTTGPKSASLGVTATTGGSATAALNGAGITPAALAVSPVSHGYGAVVLATNSVDVTYTISNSGGGVSGVPSVSLSGGDASQFVIAQNGCAGTLSGGQSCTVQAHFSPTTAGAKSAALAVTATPGGSASAALTGSGITAAQLAGPMSLAFGSVLVGQSRSPDSTVTITNSGGASSGIPSLSLSGANASDFVIAQNGCTVALAGGQSCALKLRFAPSGRGARAATLTVAANPGGTIAVGLAGSGVAPALLSATPTTLAFGNVPVGMGSAMTVTVTNVGDLPTSAITVAPQTSADFAVKSDACTAQTLAGGASCTYTVRFLPTAFGAESASFTASATTGGSAGTTATATGQDTVTLTITLAGNGSGTVFVNGGTGCSVSPCVTSFTRTTSAPTASVVAVPATGSSFTGFSGACSGGSCMLTLSGGSPSVTATFALQSYPLTVALNDIEGATGSVTSLPAGINCGATCTASYNYNTSVTLTATPTGTAHFGGWSGDCISTQPTCTVAVTRARNVTAAFTNANYLFVTSTSVVPGALSSMGGGNPLAAADAICKTRAAAGGLPGNYIAMLSTSTTNFVSRLNGATGWVRPDGLPVTTNFLDVAMSNMNKMFYLPRLDELGQPVDDVLNPRVNVVTGTNTDGTASTSNCKDWTSSAFSDMAAAGTESSYGYDTWFSAAPSCSQAAPLYCWGIDYKVDVTPPKPPAGARLMFIPVQFYFPQQGGSIADADALCQNEATAKSLPGTYRALLATTTATAASRFDLTRPTWYRLDGVKVFENAADLASPKTPLMTGPVLESDGVTYGSAYAVWTGAVDANTVATAAESCNNWSTSSPAVRSYFGEGSTTVQQSNGIGWFYWSDVGCDFTSGKVYCFEE